MKNHLTRLTLGLMFGSLLVLVGCGSGGGGGAGMGNGVAGETGAGSEGGAGEAGQAGGGALAGNTGEAGQTAATSTAIAGSGGSTGAAGSPASSTTKPTGGSATGGKTTTTSTTTSGGAGDVASQYVDAINAVRAQVTKPANYTGTWAPLPNVAWSDTVAASAQAWANNLATTQNCKLVHESQNTYGENLAMGTNLSPKQAVDMWTSEKDLYTWSPTYTAADFNAGSGHYTQLVWRKSTQIGCGSATCSRNVVISCRFSPPGNFMGQAAY